MTPTTYEMLREGALAGTLTDEQIRHLEAYHADHPDLAAAFTADQATWQRMIAEPRPMRPDAYWDALTDRIMVQADAQDRVNGRAPLPASPRPFAPWHMLRDLLSAPLPRLALQTTFAVLLVALGVVLGRSVFDDQPPPVVATTTTPAGEVLSVAAEDAAWRYIDRSKVLLLGIVNAETPETANLARKQAIATELVASAPELREALSAADQQRLADLVADLEVLLLQIANLEAQADVPGLQRVQHGADRKGIFLKISLEEIRRFEAPPQPATSSESADAI